MFDDLSFLVKLYVHEPKHDKSTLSTKEEDGLHRDILVVVGAAVVKTEASFYAPSKKCGVLEEKWIWARRAVKMNSPASLSSESSEGAPATTFFRFRQLCFQQLCYGTSSSPSSLLESARAKDAQKALG